MFKPLHWHCPTCGHCASAHQLCEAFDPREELVLMCAGCREHQYRCPAEAFHSTRAATLANMHAQAMHDDLQEVGL